MKSILFLITVSLLLLGSPVSANELITFEDVAPSDSIVISQDVTLDDDSILTFHYPSKIYDDVSYFPIRIELTHAPLSTEVTAIRDFVAGPHVQPHIFENLPLQLNQVSPIIEFVYDDYQSTRTAYSPIVYSVTENIEYSTNILGFEFNAVEVPRTTYNIISPNEIFTTSTNPIAINDLINQVSIVDNQNNHVSNEIIIINDTYSNNQSTPGTYYITWSINESESITSTTIINVSSESTQNPYITLNGNKTIYVEVGNEYVELGASAFENDTQIPISISGNVNPNLLGTYTITYQATDSLGNQISPITRQVIVRDTTNPIIMINGDQTITLEYGEMFIEPGAIVKDNHDSNLDVIVQGSIDHETLGTYEITYLANDSSNNAAKPITRTVTIVDTTSPIISTQDVYFNNTVPFTAEDILGQFTATDNYDGDISHLITFVSNDAVGYEDTPGSYGAFVSVEDSSGNKIYSVFDIIVEDSEPPEFIAPTHIYKSLSYITKSDFYLEYIEAHDLVDGELTDSITYIENNYIGNANTEGEYLITLSVKDSANNETLHDLTIHVVSINPLIIIDNTHFIVSHETKIDDLDIINTLKQINAIPNDTYVYNSIKNDYIEKFDVIGSYQNEFFLNSHSGNDYSYNLTFEVIDPNTNIINQSPSFLNHSLIFIKKWWWIPTTLTIIIIGLKKQRGEL